MNTILWKYFLKSRMARLSALILLGFGGLSLIFGKHLITQKAQVNSHVAVLQQQVIDQNTAIDEAGLLLYYLRFLVEHRLPPIAVLNIGQSDVIPQLKFIKILGFENQKYDADLINPTHLQLGTLDLSFVILYIFPLVIIALMYHLISEEQEKKRWDLIRTQGLHPRKYLHTATAIRLIFCLLLLGILLGVASIWLSIPVDKDFWSFTSLSIVYLLFWFALSFAMVSFQKSSHVNLLSLLSAWLIGLVLLPAAFNSYINHKYPIPEAYTGMIKQRDSYHTKWDGNKKATLSRFYQIYPQFESYGYPPEQGFNWLWYYAMQHMGDDESKFESQLIEKQIQARETKSKQLAYFFPPLHTQLGLNSVAQTDISSYLWFQQKSEAYHEELRMQFYPLIFDNRSVKEMDWTRYNRSFSVESAAVSIQFGGPIWLWIIALWILGWWQLRLRD